MVVSSVRGHRRLAVYEPDSLERRPALGEFDTRDSERMADAAGAPAAWALSGKEATGIVA